MDSMGITRYSLTHSLTHYSLTHSLTHSGDERIRWSHKLCDYLYDYHGDDQVNTGHTVENVDVLDGFIYEGAQDYVRLLILVGIGYTGADGEPTPTSDLFIYSISYNILVSQPSPEILGCGRVGAISNILHGKLSPRMYRNVRDYRCASTYITFTRESQLYSCHVALDDILYRRHIAVHKLLSYAHCKTDRIVNVDVTPLQEGTVHHSLTHSLTYLLTYLLTHLLTHSLTYSLTYSLTARSR